MNATLRAVLFDCDGVLQRPANDWADQVGTLTGLDGTRLQDLLDDISDAERPVLDGSDAFAPRLQVVLDTWGLPVRAEDVLPAWQDLVVDEGMLDAVRDLRARGLRCALATNQHRERAAYMRRALGYDALFDPIVISAEIGTAKPQTAYFRHAVAALGLPAGQVLFVDDVRANVEGARSAGLVAETFAADAGRDELDRILALHGLADRAAA